MSEPILEPIWRFLRFSKVLQNFDSCDVLVDIGCGPKAPFLKYARKFYKKAVGIDPLTESSLTDNYKLIKSKLDKVDLPNNYADCVTLLAAIEHFDEPLKVLSEIKRILKPGGKLIITTPSPLNWAVLEILSRLGLQSKREIDEHENYFFKKSIVRLLSKAGFKNISHEYFEFYLNNFVCAQK